MQTATSSSLPTTPQPRISRNTAVVLAVVVFHIALLWALQAGLLRRITEAVVLPEMLVEIMAPASPAPPAPTVTPPTPKPVAKTTPTPPTPAKEPTPVAPAPMAVAQASPVELPNAVTAAPASASTSTNSSNSTTTNATPLPKVVPPSSDADYLNNPKPAYPRLSKTLNEQGTVMVSVFIGTDGNPQKVELKKSSGFDRLDKTALDAVRGWRFVPGSRGGVPEAMWVVVPIPFVLTK